MAPVEHEHAKIIFRQLDAVDIMHSSSVYRTFGDDSRGRLCSRQSARIVVVMVAQLLDKGAALCFINLAQGVVWIHKLMQPSVDFLAQKKIKVQKVSQNSLFKVIRHECVALGGPLF